MGQLHGCPHALVFIIGHHPLLRQIRKTAIILGRFVTSRKGYAIILGMCHPENFVKPICIDFTQSLDFCFSLDLSQQPVIHLFQQLVHPSPNVQPRKILVYTSFKSNLFLGIHHLQPVIRSLTQPVGHLNINV